MDEILAGRAVPVPRDPHDEPLPTDSLGVAAAAAMVTSTSVAISKKCEWVARNLLLALPDAAVSNDAFRDLLLRAIPATSAPSAATGTGGAAAAGAPASSAAVASRGDKAPAVAPPQPPSRPLSTWQLQVLQSYPCPPGHDLHLWLLRLTTERNHASQRESQLQQHARELAAVRGKHALAMQTLIQRQQREMEAIMGKAALTDTPYVIQNPPDFSLTRPVAEMPQRSFSTPTQHAFSLHAAAAAGARGAPPSQSSMQHAAPVQAPIRRSLPQPAVAVPVPVSSPQAPVAVGDSPQ